MNLKRGEPKMGKIGDGTVGFERHTQQSCVHYGLLTSVHPETVFWPNFCVMLKILSSEYHIYTCDKIFRMPRSLRLPELERKSSFLDEH